MGRNAAGDAARGRCGVGGVIRGARTQGDLGSGRHRRSDDRRPDDVRFTTTTREGARLFLSWAVSMPSVREKRASFSESFVSSHDKTRKVLLLRVHSRLLRRRRSLVTLRVDSRDPFPPSGLASRRADSALARGSGAHLHRRMIMHARTHKRVSRLPARPSNGKDRASPYSARAHAGGRACGGEPLLSHSAQARAPSLRE